MSLSPPSSSSINNKPRPPLNKSRMLNKNSRASTLPSLLPPHHNTSTPDNTEQQEQQGDFLPSVQESLQDWLTRSIPSSDMESFDIIDECKCCKRNDCDNLEVLKKLESDSRLAAEIGQSLLAKHEQFVSRSNEIKFELEAKVERLEFKVDELETNLCESENLRQDLIREKDRLIWECQKTQKVLDETVIDLETSNDRCIHLGSELKNKISEVEKLRIFKFMARQADIREDNLRAQLEDIKQELALSRKAELTLESKYKKLKSKYESTCISYEKLKSDYQEFGLATNHQLDLVWLKESNERLRKDVLKLTSALLTHGGGSGSNAYTSNETINHLIQLVKELASANNKLKSDLLDCSDLLLEYRNDLYLKIIQEEEEENDIMQHDESNSYYAATTAITKEEGRDNDEVPPAATADLLWLQQIQQQQQQETDDDETTKVDVTQQQKKQRQNSNESDTSSTINKQQQQIIDSSTAATIVHHHYHYYMKNKMLAAAEKEKKGDEKGKRRKSATTDSETQTPSLIAIEADEQPKKIIDTSSPFRQLYNQVTNLLTRLEQTDIRALNRRLKRAFDMIELSSMSNSILENIVMQDIDGLRTHFLWIQKQPKQDEAWIHDISMLEFFPLLGLVQNMLKEIGQLRITMNDLQVEYVKKVEESDVRLSQDMKRKQLIEQEEAELQKRKKNLFGGDTTASPISSWFSKVFNTNSDKKKEQQQSISGYTAFNNLSDTSIKSSSAAAAVTVVHPLSMPPSFTTTTAATATTNANGSTSTIEKSSMIAIIRRKKSDILIDRHGPPSSFPTRSSNFLPTTTNSILSTTTNNKRRSTTTTVSCSPKTTASFLTLPPPPPPMRASQSAGTVRKSKSMQAPALVVKRKKSTLGLSVSSQSDENSNSMTFTSWYRQ